MKEGRRTWAGTGAVALATIVALSGTAAARSASPSSSDAGANEPLTFTFADVIKPSGLNPMVGYLGTDYVLWAMNYDLPINFSAADMNPDLQHSITTSVDTSSDGMTFTYHLRAGMKWSDGKPFTASDMAWTLNYYKRNDVPNYSADLALFKHAVATNPTTMVMTATQPTSLYSGKTVFMYEYILPEHIWGKYENNYKAALRDPNVPSVGSGPFIIKKYVPDQYVELDRNPYYWGDSDGLTPHVQRVVYEIFGNADAEAAALQSGAIDFGYFTAPSILNTLKARGINVRGAVVPSFGEIGINNGSAYETYTAGGFNKHGDGAYALTQVVVRQAIRMAVDSKSLVDKVLLGYGTPGISPVQPSATTGDWKPGPDDPDLSWNIAGANTLLDNAGYKMGPNGVRIDPKTGKPLEFRFFTRSNDAPSTQMVPYIQGWLQQIGIKLDPQAMNATKLGNVILAGDYDLFEWGWYPNPDPNYILNIFTCAQRPPDPGTYRTSDMYYCNPKYDALYHDQQSVLDPTRRTDIVHQMQSILYRDEPYVVLWNDATLEAWSPKWTGFTSQPAVNGDVLATYGPFSFISLRPVTGSSGGTTSNGIPAWLWLALAGVLIVVGLVVVRARRGDHEDEA